MIIEKRAEMKKELQAPTDHIYWIYGEEPYLAARCYASLLKAFSFSEKDGFNFQKFVGPQVSWQDVSVSLNTLPVFATRKAVVAENVGLAQMNADGREELAAILKEIPPETVFILADLSASLEGTNGAQAKKNRDFFSKFGVVFHFLPQKEEDIIRFILSYVTKQGGTTDRDAAQRLLAYCGLDFTRLRVELDKLLAFSPQVSLSSIQELVTPRLEESVFALTKAVEKEQYEEALGVLARLRDGGEEAVVILQVLALHFIDLFRAMSARLEGKNPEEMKKDFLYQGRDFVVQRAFREAGRLPCSVVLAHLETLHKADLSLKTGSFSPFLVLEQAVTELFLNQAQVGAFS